MESQARRISSEQKRNDKRMAQTTQQLINVKWMKIERDETVARRPLAINGKGHKLIRACTKKCVLKALNT